MGSLEDIHLQTRMQLGSMLLTYASLLNFVANICCDYMLMLIMYHIISSIL